MDRRIKALPVTLLAAALLIATSARAGDPDTTLAAVADVLFDMGIENASFKARHDGHLDIEFGPSLPDEQYAAAIARLKAHPDIPGLLAGRGGRDYCPVP